MGYLAETTITMEELLALQIGDILQTSKAASDDSIIQVGTENKFAGKSGRHKENIAIKITRMAEVEEPL